MTLAFALLSTVDPAGPVAVAGSITMATGAQRELRGWQLAFVLLSVGPAESAACTGSNIVATSAHRR